MADLKTLLKRLDVVRGKILDIAEHNYQDMLDDGGFSPKNKTRAQKAISEKSKKLRAEEDRLESDIKKLKGKKTLFNRSGGAGGRMMMPQEYSKRTLYKPKTN